MTSLAPSHRARIDGTRYTVVRSTNLTIAPGVSVVGPMGCGKSTLLNVSAGLLALSSSSVSVFGEPLRGINKSARAICFRPKV